MELLYGGFILFVCALLALDLGVFHRKLHVIGVREALGWSGFWIGLGASFAAFVWVGYEHRWFGLGTTVDAMVTPTLAADGTVIYNDGASAAIKYLTGFVVEKSLAIDNLFVIAMIFASFRIPAIYQHRVLFWGILGALVMRGAMIALGAALITNVSWIIYVFGGFLIVTGLKMLLIADQPHNLGVHAVVRLMRRIIPITEHNHGSRFFVRAGTPASLAPAVAGGPAERDGVVEAARRGALLATPLFMALVLIEIADLVFAVDSIPAIFAITTDPFLVFTSNVFAILGMRSLYFALAGMIERFRYLKVALACVLLVVGVKMLAHGWLKSVLGAGFNFYVLGIIAAILAAGVVASILVNNRDRRSLL
ncbi:MAG: TerC family protein [Myxococcota bacterium]|nr:TerC family protein [Myxococcota bacterium]